MQDLLQGDANHAALWLMLLIVGTLLPGYLNYFTSLGSFEVAIALLSTLRHRIGDHVVSLPLGWFTSRNTSQLGVLLSQGGVEILGLPVLTNSHH